MADRGDGPVVAILAGVSSVFGSLFGAFDPVLAFLQSTAGTWFPAILAIRSIAPEVEAIPTGLITQVAIGATLVYVSFKVGKIANKGLERL